MGVLVRVLILSLAMLGGGWLLLVALPGALWADVALDHMALLPHPGAVLEHVGCSTPWPGVLTSCTVETTVYGVPEQLRYLVFGEISAAPIDAPVLLLTAAGDPSVLTSSLGLVELPRRAFAWSSLMVGYAVLGLVCAFAVRDAFRARRALNVERRRLRDLAVQSPRAVRTEVFASQG